MSRPSVRERLEDALIAADYEHGREIAFHMTDWLDDLDGLVKLYDDPAQYETDEIVDVLMAFLIHVPNHVAAASKLMLDIPVNDIFEVGATTDNEA